MATEEALHSHHTSTSESLEQSVKLSSEAVKATENITISLQKESVEDDTKPEEKAEDIQIEPLVTVKRPDETPAQDQTPAALNEKEEEKKTEIINNPELLVHPTATSAKEPPASETVSVEKDQKEQPETSCVTESSVEAPPEEKQAVEIPPMEKPIEVIEKEIVETVKPLKDKELPSEVQQSIEKTTEKISESPVEVHPMEEPEVTAKQASESSEPPINQEQPDEVLPIKESGEAKEKETSSSKEAEKQGAVAESVSVEKEKKEQPVTSCSPESSVESPEKEKQPIVAVPVEEPANMVQKEITEMVEPPEEKKLPFVVHPVLESAEVTTKEISESIELTKENELPVEVHPVEELEVTAKQTGESSEPPKIQEQPDEILPIKETGEVIAKEISDSSEALIEKESGEAKEKEICSFQEAETQEPATESVSVEKEKKEQPATSCAPESSVEPPEKEKQPIEVLPVEEPAEMIQKEVIEIVEPPKEKEQPFEVHPVQESGEVAAKEISESIELAKGSELHDEVHPVKELEEIAKETTESIEPPKNIEQPDEVLPMKETEVMAKEISESSGPLKNEEQTDEISTVTDSGEAKETGGSTMCSNVEKQEPEAVEVKDGPKELPEINNQVIVNGETVKDEGSSAPRIDITPPLEGGKTHKEEQCAAEGDELYLVGKVTQPDPAADSGKDSEKEQSATEFVNVEKAPKGEPETTCVTKLSVEAPKKEERSIEVLPLKEPVEVVTKEIIETDEPPKEMEQPIEVHPVSETTALPKKKEQVTEVHLVHDSKEVIAADHAPESSAEISEPKELPKEKEQATEVYPVQASREVIGEKIIESVELPKENEPVLEVHQEQQSREVMAKEACESIEPPNNKEQPDEVLPGKESESTIKEVSASSVPTEKKEQPYEVIPTAESEDVKEKETSDSTLGSKEVEKPEPEVIKVQDAPGEEPEITNQNHNNHVEVETEAIMKYETLKDEKSLTLGDEVNQFVGGGHVHKAEEQCSVESDKQDSLAQVAQPDVVLAARDISPQHLEEKASQENENKESSHIDLVQKISEVEQRGVEKVGEAKEENVEKTDREDTTLSAEEEAAKGSKTSTEVAEKSINDKEAGEVLVAETKIESVEDYKPALIETDNADHVDGKLNVNETLKELEESEVEVKDKETMTTGDEIPKPEIQNKEPSKKEDDEIKVSEKLQKEVLSKPAHKQSHNLLSKVKQSLVKAKKAIIGKSPGSKTLSAEAKDDIKVK